MYEKLKDKAQRILKSNIYEENTYLWGKYRMISPDRNHFSGVWNWDSAFHALGMTYLDCELAKEQLLGFFQFQKEDGMLPDVVRENGEIADISSKPPVMAYAAERIFKNCNNTDFLKEIYPRLVKNTQFWENKRQINGLFHYDAEKTRCCDEAEYLREVCYESG